MHIPDIYLQSERHVTIWLIFNGNNYRLVKTKKKPLILNTISMCPYPRFHLSCVILDIFLRA